MGPPEPVTIQDIQRVLRRSSPVLPRQELLAFVETFFNLRDNYLGLLDAHAPPLYVLETAVLTDRARRFRQAFERVLPRVSFYYAVKSNNHPEVARTLLASGFGLDVSSGLELGMALSLGAKDIVFSGPGKTDRELQLAAAHGGAVSAVLIDSFGELERLEAVAAAGNTEIRAGVRVAIDPSGLWRKFGILLDRLPAFWEMARHCTHVRVQGVQFHSSWNLSPGPQTDFIKALGKAMQAMPGEFLDQMDFIDIGGGYWPPQGEWLQAAGTPEGALRAALGRAVCPETHYRLPAASISEFADHIGAAVAKHIHALVPCRVCLEPGRWICNDAMHLLMSVVDKKEEDLVITDAGTNTVGWERFETDYFPVLNLTRPAMEERPCHILGSLCTPHDLWGYAYWGNDIQPGDILMIPTQGAYTYSLRQHFIKPLPAVIAL